MSDTYNVSMGQAVSVSDLGENTLVTGMTSLDGNFDPGRALVSCSAVAMVNTRTGAAGLFHFPSGDINDTRDAEVRRSRDTLTALYQDVQPNKVFFGHGPGLDSNNLYSFTPQLNENLETEQGNLRQFVQRLAPDGRMSEEFGDAKYGGFLIRRSKDKDESGRYKFAMDLEPDDTDIDRVVDLSEARAGSYNNRYRVYGRTVSEQAAEDQRLRREYEALRRSMSGSRGSSPAPRSQSTPSGSESGSRGNSPAPRDQSAPRGSMSITPAPQDQPGPSASGPVIPAPQEQFEVDDSIPNLPPRHKRRWLKKAIRRMTCRGG